MPVNTARFAFIWPSDLSRSGVRRNWSRKSPDFWPTSGGTRRLFGNELARRGVRRCRSYWLCGIGGYLLGLITGMLGKSAIAATTIAIEQVVLRHLVNQVSDLAEDPAAQAIVAGIIAEEQSHLDESHKHLGLGGPWQTVVTPVVSSATEVVIWMGMRL